MRRITLALVACAMMPFSAATANAPSGRYTVGNGTVYDTRTKLTWQQQVGSSSYVHADAASYCANLGASVGGTGWRIPTFKELLTTVAVTNHIGPWIDQTAFPATPAGFYWSSTLQPGTDSTYFAVRYDDLLQPEFEPQASTSACNVRCVR